MPSATTSSRSRARTPSPSPASRGLRKNPKAGVSVRAAKAVRVEKAVTVNASPADLFEFWRDPSNLTKIIHHRATITVTSPTDSHWSVSAPLGRVEWDSIIFKEIPDELIAWRSAPGGDVANAGSVRFVPSGGGTEVVVEMEYDPPGGKLGAAIAKLTRDSAGSQVHDALQRLKELFEGVEARDSAVRSGKKATAGTRVRRR